VLNFARLTLLTCRRSGIHKNSTPAVTLRWTDRDAIEPVAMAAD
jgi:hypothetical protein